jgi:HEAT repeat protein
MNLHNQKKDFNDLIRQLFNAEKWEKRANAALELGYLRDKRATNLLIKALNKESDISVLNRIVEALGRLKDPKATIPLIRLLKRKINEVDPDKDLVFVIIESLMKLGDKRALTELGLIMDSCDEEIRGLTEQTLDCIDSNWRENLSSLKNDKKQL